MRKKKLTCSKCNKKYHSANECTFALQLQNNDDSLASDNDEDENDDEQREKDNNENNENNDNYENKENNEQMETDGLLANEATNNQNFAIPTSTVSQIFNEQTLLDILNNSIESTNKRNRDEANLSNSFSNSQIISPSSKPQNKMVRASSTKNLAIPIQPPPIIKLDQNFIDIIKLSAAKMTKPVNQNNNTATSSNKSITTSASSSSIASTAKPSTNTTNSSNPLKPSKLKSK